MKGEIVQLKVRCKNFPVIGGHKLTPERIYQIAKESDTINTLLKNGSFVGEDYRQFLKERESYMGEQSIVRVCQVNLSNATHKILSFKMDNGELVAKVRLLKDNVVIKELIPRIVFKSDLSHLNVITFDAECAIETQVQLLNGEIITNMQENSMIIETNNIMLLDKISNLTISDFANELYSYITHIADDYYRANEHCQVFIKFYDKFKRSSITADKVTEYMLNNLDIQSYIANYDLKIVVENSIIKLINTEFDDNTQTLFQTLGAINNRAILKKANVFIPLSFSKYGSKRVINDKVIFKDETTCEVVENTNILFDDRKLYGVFVDTSFLDMEKDKQKFKVKLSDGDRIIDIEEIN